MPGQPDVPFTQPQRLGFLALLALIAAVTLAHPSAARLHVWPWRGLALLVWWVPCGLFLRLWVSQQRHHAPPPLLSSGAALLAGTTVAAAALGPYGALSLPHVWPTLAGVALLFWLFDQLASEPTRACLLARVLSGAGAAVAVVSLVQWGSGETPWIGRNEMPFGHSIYLAGAMVLLLPWLGWAVWRTSGVERAAWMIATGLAAGALGSTSSRGGIVATGVALGIGAGWTVLRARWSWSRKALLIGGVAVVAVAGVASNQRLRDLALSGGWSESARESNAQRMAMIEAGLELGRERPLLGWGPGTVPIGYPQVRAGLSGGVDNVLQLHNTPLQLWATLGSTGALAAALLGFGVLTAIYRALSRGAEGFSPEALTATASTIGYVLFALTDHQLDVPLMNFAVVANVAILAAAALRATGSDLATNQGTVAARPAIMGTLLGLTLVAIPLWPTVRDLLGRRAYAADDLESAIAWMPADPYYQHQLAARLAAEREHSTDAAERQRLAGAAADALLQSLTTQAHTEYAHFNLGWLLLELGRPAEAAKHFRTAAQLAPLRGGVYLGLGFASLQLDQEAAAVRAFAIEALNDSRALSAPFWERDGPLAALRPRVLNELEQIGAATPSVVTRIAWIRWWTADPAPLDAPTGFSDASRAFVAALPTIEARRPLAELSHQWGRLYSAWRENDWEKITRDDALLAALQARANRHPNDFLGFLRAGTENEPAFSRVLRRIRPGYGVVTFHPDGAPPADMLLIPENRFVAEFAHELFPRKGDLPARVVLQLLPPTPES